MKEQDIDKFVGKKVTITDIDGDTEYGYLYKIVDHYVEQDRLHVPHAVKNGYYLHKFYLKYGGGIDYRKSHIKKIQLVEGKRRG